MVKVRKAVIPAAGLGTRFLPLTKAVPKELLPLVDKAAIQYVVEEAVEAGIEHVVIIIAPGKETISGYFRRNPSLEGILATRQDYQHLSQLEKLSDIVEITYVYQSEQLGLGHAVMCASSVVGEEPFAVMLPDDIIIGERGALSQLMEIFNEYETSVIAVEEVQGNEIQSYGVIVPERVNERVFRVLGTVEKPDAANAPSNLGIVGRYILSADIFGELESVAPGAMGEIQLTDGLELMLQNQHMYALRFQGIRYDVGNPLGLLKASVDLALRREDMGSILMEFLNKFIR